MARAGMDSANVGETLVWAARIAGWLARRYGADEEDARQQLLLEVLQGVKGRRAVLRVIRTLARHEFPRYASPPLDLESLLARPEGLSAEMIDLLAEVLSEREWLVVETNILRGRTMAETSRALGLGKRSIERVKRHALLKLRHALEGIPTHEPKPF